MSARVYEKIILYGLKYYNEVHFRMRLVGGPVGYAINYLLGALMALATYILFKIYRKRWGPKGVIFTTRRVAIITILLALSIVGAMIPVGPTVALDSLAGFFGACYFGLVEGALVLALGCFISHFFKGMAGLIPIVWTSYPAMALAGAGLAYCYRRFRKPINWVTGFISAVAANTLGCLVPLCFVWGLGVMLPYFPILALASSINVIIALILAEVIAKIRPPPTT